MTAVWSQMTSVLSRPPMKMLALQSPLSGVHVGMHTLAHAHSTPEHSVGVSSSVSSSKEHACDGGESSSPYQLSLGK